MWHYPNRKKSRQKLEKFNINKKLKYERKENVERFVSHLFHAFTLEIPNIFLLPNFMEKKHKEIFITSILFFLMTISLGKLNLFDFFVLSSFKF